MTKKLLDNHFLKGSIVFTTVSFVVSVFTYFFNLLVARGVNLTSYGEYMTAVSYTTLLGVVFGALNVIVIRKIGRADVADRSSYAHAIEQWLIDNITRFAFPLFIVTGVVGGILMWKANLEAISVLFVISLTAISLFTLFYTAVLQAYKSFVDAGRFLFVGIVLKLIGGAITIFFFPNLLALYISIVVSQALSLLYGKYLLQKNDTRRHLTKVPKIEFHSITTYLKRKSIIIPTLTTFGLIALANADLIIVKKFFSGDEVGLYAGFALLSRIILYIAQPLAAVAYSFFIGSESKHTSSKVLWLCILAISILGVGSLAGYTLLPHLVIDVIFGSRFYALSSLLWLAAVFGTLNSFVTLLAQYWIAHNSYIGTLSLVAAIAQVIGIALFHASFTQVMIVNIIISSCVLLCYSLPLLTRFRKASRSRV
jgi:O-antigen/teichoic acid export membrane protein